MAKLPGTPPTDAIRDSPISGAVVVRFGLIVLATAVDVFIPVVMGRVVDGVADKHPKEDLYPLCYVFAGLILSAWVFNAIKGYIIQATGQKIQHELRSELFKRVLRFPIGYFDKNPVGRPLTRVVNDVKTLGEIFSASLSIIVLDVLTITSTVGAMFYLNWQLAGVVLLVFPLVVLTIHWFSQKLQEAYREARYYLSEINAFLGENIGGIATIQRLAAQGARLKSFSTIVDNHFSAQMKTLQIYAYIQPLANAYNGVSTALLVGVGGYWVVQGEVTVGLLVTFYGYIRNIYQPVRDLVEKFNMLLSAKVSGERISSLMEEPVETSEADFCKRREVDATALSIAFSGVHFRYPTREKNALSDINFQVPAGRSLAIVGPTGGGKSSIVRLLLRFYEPTSGTIKLGGRNIQDWSKADLRSHIGMVHQEIYLVRGTVRENLSLGHTEFSDTYLTEKCKAAQIWESLAPRGGLDFLIYEGGANLSQGERQLLSFARILAFNPPVLILDEATAHIDKNIENQLMQALATVLTGRTSIVIAHRLSTIERCDEVLVIQEGRVTQRGKFKDLANTQGKFRTLHQISIQQGEHRVPVSS